MGEIKTKVGQPIRLDLQLTDYNDDQYVRATLRDESGALLGTQDLSNSGQGLYSDDSQIMPDKPQVTATYVVYKDSGFTEINDNYTGGFDTFMRDDNATVLDEINNKVSNLASGIAPSELIGEIIDEETLSGSIEENMVLSGEVIESEELDGVVSDEMIEGTTESDDILKGSISE